MTRRTFVAAFFSVAALLTSQGPSPLAAQEFPSRTIRIISPFPPGAGPDVMIRILGESLSAILKQPVVIEAKPGGSGIPAMEAIKSALPDGHVLGLTSDQNLTILPHINPSIPYDPKVDFTPVSRILSSSYFVLVASKGPYSSLKDLIADARSAPRKVSFGTQAIGSQAHLGAALFGSLIGAEMVLVPYRDMSQLFLNIGNGDVGWVLSTAASASAFLQNGTIKPLAIAQRARSPQFPDVPTVAEAAGFEFEFGAVARSGGPARPAARGRRSTQRSRQNGGRGTKDAGLAAQRGLRRTHRQPRGPAHRHCRRPQQECRAGETDRSHPAIEITIRQKRSHKRERNMSTKKPDPRDAAVGQRVRALRLERNMSQTNLADALGLTFQQVQKYEKGANRIGAGRLQQIAEIFEVPVGTLFGASNSNSTPSDSLFELVDASSALRLLRAYSQITNPAVKNALTSLAEQIAAGDRHALLVTSKLTQPSRA